MRRHKIINTSFAAAIVLVAANVCNAGSPGKNGLHVRSVAYDMQRAMEICDSLPLENPEGIWICPDDKVALLIRRTDTAGKTSFGKYEMSVVETEDARLHPGEVVGYIEATASPHSFKATLFTKRKTGRLLDPKESEAKLSNDGDNMVLYRETKFPSLRISLNPYQLMPGLWRVIRLNSSLSNDSKSSKAVGMIRIYPSYDGNGSSRRSPRYL